MARRARANLPPFLAKCSDDQIKESVMVKRNKGTAAADNTAGCGNSETALEKSKADESLRRGRWRDWWASIDETVVTEEEAYEAIEEAFREFQREGRIYDSGERRWSNQTQRYEIVWKPKTSGLLWGGA
jgi:hypothetical protein